MSSATNISELSDKEKQNAIEKYRIIEPFLNTSKSLTKISQESHTSLRTLQYWVKKYRAMGLVGLSRLIRNDKGVPRKLSTSLIKTIEGMYLKYPETSYTSLHRTIKKYCQKNNIKLPSYRSLCRIINNIPEDVVTYAHEGSKSYRQKYDLLCIRESSEPNECWQADHVMMDIDVLNEKNIPQRPWLTVIIDDYSRVICGYELSFLSPSAEKTSLCLRHAIWRKEEVDWPVLGIPKILYTDHGSDFTSKHIEEVCLDLKTMLIFSQVGQPRGRGKIERFFRTLNQLLLTDLSIVLAERTGSKLISLQKLNQLILKFINKYNHSIHSETGMEPIKRWVNNGFIPNMVDSLECLDLLLLTEIRPRIIRRDGIHFQGLRYFDLTLAEYIGETINIRYKPSDITSIRVFFNGKFLCQPICAELSNQSISIKDIMQARNKRRRLIKQEVSERKSLIEAVIDSSRQDLKLSDDCLETKTEKPKIKLRIYKNE